MPFFIDEARDLAVAQIPKAGIQSFKEWLGPSFDVVENDDSRLLSVTRRVAFIRNPQERLKSAFSFMYWLEEYGNGHHSRPDVADWRRFVDHILDPATPVNEHWQPINPRLEVYSTDFTDKDWRSWSAVQAERQKLLKALAEQKENG